MRQVKLLPVAARQVADARDWWAEHREKAPEAFDVDFAEVVDLIAEAPELAGLPVRQRAGVRRVLLRRVRYFLYYTFDTQTVTVIAVWHTSRGNSPDL